MKENKMQLNLNKTEQIADCVEHKSMPDNNSKPSFDIIRWILDLFG